MFRIYEKAYKTCRFRACPFRGNPDLDRSPSDGKALKSLHFVHIDVYPPHPGGGLYRDHEKAYKTCRFRACPFRRNPDFDRAPIGGNPLKPLHFCIMDNIFNLFHEPKA